MPGYTRVLTLAAILIAAFITSANDARAESAQEMLGQYVDLVLSGNAESARQYWTYESLRRSSRFGIEYIDVDYKWDCASPLVHSIDLVRGYPQRLIGEETLLGTGECSRVEFILPVGPDTTRHYYYTYQQGDYYWLMYPQDFFSLTWDTTETKFFKIIYEPDDRAFLNPIALRKADEFVEKVARELHIDKSDLQLLEKEKIYYFFADSDVLMRDMIGYLTKGAYDLASDDIMSAFFPHYHEMVHFLVNFKLRRLPMYTLPVLREGLAVYYGGRWGKSPVMLLSLAGYLYRQGVISVDSILTRQEFEGSVAADMSYPMAGLFTAFLIDKKGTKTYLKLYRELSGGSARLNSMTIDEIQAAISSALGKSSWQQVLDDFAKFTDNWLDKYAAVYPGAKSGGDVLVDTDRFSITKDGKWLSLVAVADSGSSPVGQMIFGFDSSLVGSRSWLYGIQYKLDTTGIGYRYGLRFDKDEIGIYDYATSEIIAKYIRGIAPSDDYYSESENKVTFRFSKDLIRDTLTPDGYRLMSE